MYKIKQMHLYLLISALIITVGFCGGYLLSAAEPSFGETLLKIFKDMVADEIMGDTPAVMALTLFLNNLEACVIIFIGGAFFGIIPVAILFFNGIIIGAILEIARKETGDFVMLVSIVPHGIFEIPAVIASGALGLMLGQAVRDEIYRNRDAAPEAYRFGRIFVRYIIPFIAIAACIEGFITPAILQMVT